MESKDRIRAGGGFHQQLLGTWVVGLAHGDGRFGSRLARRNRKENHCAGKLNLKLSLVACVLSHYVMLGLNLQVALISD